MGNVEDLERERARLLRFAIYLIAFACVTVGVWAWLLEVARYVDGKIEWDLTPGKALMGVLFALAPMSISSVLFARYVQLTVVIRALRGERRRRARSRRERPEDPGSTW